MEYVLKSTSAAEEHSLVISAQKILIQLLDHENQDIRNSAFELLRETLEMLSDSAEFPEEVEGRVLASAIIHLEDMEEQVRPILLQRYSSAQLNHAPRELAKKLVLQLPREIITSCISAGLQSSRSPVVCCSVSMLSCLAQHEGGECFQQFLGLLGHSQEEVRVRVSEELGQSTL